jgi:hypothetical protein
MLRRAARIGFEAWNRGDLALVVYLDDPKVETHVVTQESGVALGFDPIYYDPEGHCRAMELWNEAWRKWDGDIVDVIEEGHDQILVIARIHCEGATSGIKLDEWGAVRYTFRDGLILRVDGAFAPDKDRAFEALRGIAGSATRSGPVQTFTPPSRAVGPHWPAMAVPHTPARPSSCVRAADGPTV